MSEHNINIPFKIIAFATEGSDELRTRREENGSITYRPGWRLTDWLADDLTDKDPWKLKLCNALGIEPSQTHQSELNYLPEGSQEEWTRPDGGGQARKVRGWLSVPGSSSKVLVETEAEVPDLSFRFREDSGNARRYNLLFIGKFIKRIDESTSLVQPSRLAAETATETSHLKADTNGPAVSNQTLTSRPKADPPVKEGITSDFSASTTVGDLRKRNKKQDHGWELIDHEDSEFEGEGGGF